MKFVIMSNSSNRKLIQLLHTQKVSEPGAGASRPALCVGLLCITWTLNHAVMFISWRVHLVHSKHSKYITTVVVLPVSHYNLAAEPRHTVK